MKPFSDFYTDFSMVYRSLRTDSLGIETSRNLLFASFQGGFLFLSFFLFNDEVNIKKLLPLDYLCSNEKLIIS